MMEGVCNATKEVSYMKHCVVTNSVKFVKCTMHVRKSLLFLVFCFFALGCSVFVVSLSTVSKGVKRPSRNLFSSLDISALFPVCNKQLFVYSYCSHDFSLPYNLHGIDTATFVKL